jgi:dienelactone hydrolase
MKRLLMVPIILLYVNILCSQQTVTFLAADSVVVTADLYVTSIQNPYLILLHQAGYSRGEYRETAPKFANLGFNCLAVDLRSGGEVNFVKNRTYADAKDKHKPTEYLDSRPDIAAAVDYVASRSNKPIILVGSSYSASLSLIEATENFKIKALVVFSPGEYFGKDLIVKEATQQLYVPVLALSSKMEHADMQNMLSHLNKKHLTLFKPTMGEGVHGSRALWEKNPNHQEYWMALTQFFSQLNIK